MTTGVLLQGIDYFDSYRPEMANAHVLRPAPDGFYDLNDSFPEYAGQPISIAYANRYLTRVPGSLMYGFFDDYYGRIHVFPNPVDFDYIATDTYRFFYVWNAYLAPQYLQIIDAANNEGLTLEGFLDCYLYAPLQSVRYTLTASVQGPAFVDATYTLNFQGLPLIPVSVLGTRTSIFPFQPNWRTPVTERLEWLTDVMESRNGDEQRQRLRQNPRLYLDYEFLVHHDDLNVLDTLLFGWQGRAWAIPLWQHGQRLSKKLVVGSTFIECGVDGYEFQENDSLMLYCTPSVYEVVTIKGLSYGGVSVDATTLTWMPGTFIFPIRIAYMQGVTEVDKITGEVASGHVQFLSQRNRPTLFSPAGVGALTSGYFPLTWGASTDPNVTGYYIYWDIISHDGGVVTEYLNSTEVLGGETSQFILSGLEPNQTYYVLITSHGAGGHDASETVITQESVIVALDPDVVSSVDLNSPPIIGSYLGLPVLELESNRANAVKHSWDRRTTVLDYGIGQFTVFDKHNFSKTTRACEFLSLNRSRVKQFRDVLYYAEGRWKEFWYATFDNDINILTTVSSGDPTLLIKKIGYTKYVNLNSLRAHLRIQLKNGTIYYRQIVGNDDINTAPGTEVITVDTPYPVQFEPTDIKFASFMPLCRLDSDSIELSWVTMTVANTTLPIRNIKVLQ